MTISQSERTFISPTNKPYNKCVIMCFTTASQLQAPPRTVDWRFRWFHCSSGRCHHFKTKEYCQRLQRCEVGMYSFLSVHSASSANPSFHFLLLYCNNNLHLDRNLVIEGSNIALFILLCLLIFIVSLIFTLIGRRACPLWLSTEIFFVVFLAPSQDS